MDLSINTQPLCSNACARTKIMKAAVHAIISLTFSGVQLGDIRAPIYQ